jgi:hypothetical protein
MSWDEDDIFRAVRLVEDGVCDDLDAAIAHVEDEEE